MLFELLVSNILNSQNDFQQKLDYKIKAKLDVKNKALNGHIIIKYTNNSPHSLEYIYFHLWANAYKNNNTAFAKQQLKNRQTDFYFSDTTQRGYIDRMNFVVNSNPAKFMLDKENPDIGILFLNDILKPGEEITIETDFFLKIPFMFSRSGFKDNFYSFTQWYPKPAVYDKYGWHHIPYLDIGEFYSEFGNYDVEITLPDNYIVSATGDLLSKSELQRLEDFSEKIKNNKLEKNFIFGDSTKYKTIRFFEKNIHDFAWFASPDFLVQIEPYSIKCTGNTVFC